MRAVWFHGLKRSKVVSSSEITVTVAAASSCSRAEGGKVILSPSSDWGVRSSGVTFSCEVHFKGRRSFSVMVDYLVIVVTRECEVYEPVAERGKLLRAPSLWLLEDAVETYGERGLQLFCQHKLTKAGCEYVESEASEECFCIVVDMLPL